MENINHKYKKMNPVFNGQRQVPRMHMGDMGGNVSE